MNLSLVRSVFSAGETWALLPIADNLSNKIIGFDLWELPRATQASVLEQASGVISSPPVLGQKWSVGLSYLYLKNARAKLSLQTGRKFIPGQPIPKIIRNLPTEGIPLKHRRLPRLPSDNFRKLVLRNNLWLAYLADA